MKFTGGDNLKGYEKLVHEVMMVNELSGGKGAYEISYAKRGRGGYSFGGNQMDLLKNKDALPVFRNILHTNGMPDEELGEIMRRVSTEGDNLSHSQRESINLILSSPKGMEQINAAYLLEIRSRITKVRSRIDSSHPAIKKVIEKDEYICAMLFDYDNQYGFDENRPMHQLLKNGAITQNDISVEIDLKNLSAGEISTKIYDFIKATKYGIDHPGDIKRRHDQLQTVVGEHQQEKIKNNVTRNNNDAIPNTPIIPQPNQKYLPEELDALAENAVKGNKKSTQENEYTLMKKGNADSSAYAAVKDAIEYVNTMKTYGFGLLQQVKDKKKIFDDILQEHNNDKNHPDVINAAQGLADARAESKNFQSHVEDAAVWGQFAVSMASQLAKVTGHSEEANKIAFYGGCLLSAGVSAAQLYAGDPRGIIGLSNSVMSLVGGASQSSSEQQMLNIILGNLQEIKQDLNVIKLQISAINENINRLSNKLADVSRHLVVITDLSIELLKEVHSLQGALDRIEFKQDLLSIEDRKLYTGFAEVENDLRHANLLNASRAEEIHRKINLYTQEVTRLKTTLKAEASELPNINNLKTVIEKRAETTQSTPDLAVLHAINLLFRSAEQILSQRFNYGTGSVEDLINIPMWQEGVRARVIFLRLLQEQNGLKAFLERVGPGPVCHAINEDITRAQHTLNQLRFLAYSDILIALMQEMHKNLLAIFDAYNTHSYITDAEGLNKYIVEAAEYRESALDQEKLKANLVKEYEPLVYKTWDLEKKLPCRDDFPAEKVESRNVSLYIAGENQSHPYEAEFQAKEGYVLLPEFKFDYTNKKEIKSLKPTLLFYQKDGFNYPKGYSFEMAFSEHLEEFTRHAGGRHRSEDITLTRSVPATGYLGIEMHCVKRIDWDEIFLQKPASKLRYDLNLSALHAIFTKVKTENLFIQLENYKYVITALVELFAKNGDEKTVFLSALEKYYLDQGAFLSLVKNGSVAAKWRRTWTNAYPDFSLMFDYIKKSYEKLNEEMKKLRPLTTDFTNKKVYIETNELIKQLRGFILLINSQYESNNNVTVDDADDLLTYLDEVSKEENKRLGNVWTTEYIGHGITGTWQREGTTRSFHVKWQKNGQNTVETKGKIFITQDNKVTMLRDENIGNPEFNKTVYSGVIDPNKHTVEGIAINYTEKNGRIPYSWKGHIYKTIEEAENVTLSAMEDATLSTMERNRFHFFK